MKQAMTSNGIRMLTNPTRNHLLFVKKLYALGTHGYKFSLLCALFLFSAYIPQSQAISLPPQVQPELLQLIRTTPNAIVNVIIQQKNFTDSLEERIVQLQGKVTKKLSIISALVAQLPARQVVSLAQDQNIRWISLDAPVVKTQCNDCVQTGNWANAYNSVIRADQVWNEAPYRQGQNVTIAVLDSGIQKVHGDFDNRIIQSVNVVYPDLFFDGYGHGTYVAGIIAGDGTKSQGAYTGVAPKATLLDVRITSFAGVATESDVVAGLQWVYEHRNSYNIRVVNLSFNAAYPQSYHTSPLTAACEVLWFNGVVVVTSAGNHGLGSLYPPANDPFIITVGAADDRGTVTLQDDQIATFSAYGVTQDGIAKPDLVAPGRNLVAALNNKYGLLALLRPQNVQNNANYFRMSGTSAAAPVVSGAVALLLQAEPTLTPDQVKQRLLTTANKNWSGYDPVKAGAGYLDIYAAIHSNNYGSANTGIPISRLLQTNTATTPPKNTLWDSVTWSTVTWSTVTWSTVTWSTVTWSSDYWEDSSSTARMNDQPMSEQLITYAMTMQAADLSNLSADQDKTTPTKIFLPVIIANDEVQTKE